MERVEKPKARYAPCKKCGHTKVVKTFTPITEYREKVRASCAKCGKVKGTYHRWREDKQWGSR